MQSSLEQLHRQLMKLRRRRRWSRWAAAWCAMGASVLWALCALFVIDLAFEPDTIQRLIVMTLAAVLLVWAFVRFVRPWLGIREGEIDLALQVEEHAGIDSDLVAAIEFESPEATTWGSARLREAVIADVAHRQQQVDFSRILSRQFPHRRVTVLAAALGIVTVAALLAPSHVRIFISRLALAGQHYPAHTVLSRVDVNGQVALTANDHSSPRTVRSAEGGPVRFTVLCARGGPASGYVAVRNRNAPGWRQIALTPVPRGRGGMEEASGPAQYTARLPALVDTIEYQVFLGDAWTNPGVIQMIPLPQVQFGAQIDAPDYMPAGSGGKVVSGIRRLTVAEGSRVSLFVTSVGGKRLASVVAVLRTPGGRARCELARGDRDGRRWILSPDRAPALKDVHDEVQFEMTVTDTDGLHPRQPVGGIVRVRADALPSGVAATVHELVLPGARPTVGYQVADDVGIGRVRIQVQVERRSSGAAPSHQGGEVGEVQVHWITPDDAKFPLLQDVLPFRGRCQIDLTPWHLAPGDRLKLTLETTDYRGSRPGKTVLGKSLYLTVSDEAGVLAAILETDRQAVKDLDEMIDRQIGLGDLW